MKTSNIQSDRLRELLEFAKQSALLRQSPVPDVARYGIFHEYEHGIADLPGLDFNNGTTDGEDEIWLVVKRLQESSAPQPESILLKTWIDLTNNPSKEPTLRSHVDIQTLINNGVITTPKDKSNFDPQQLLALAAFDRKKAVDDQFKAYIENVWKPWAAEEKRRRKTISLYAKLFTLKQQLEGGIVDAQIELVWGSGIAVWNMAGTQVIFPLVTRLVELSLNETTMEIEVRPRDIDPRIELDIYSVKDNPGVPDTEKAAKEFFSKAATTFSPFDRSSFEPLLRSAVTYLDPKGIYWPSRTSADDRSIPKISEELKITDTWVLFARPRSASLFIQDIERFKKKLDDETIMLPPPVTAIVIDPATTNEDVPLPPFRGVSTICGSTGQDGKTVQDLFFPMPFNDEQVRIVQLLECSDGVVVQGPPGTGKTHTIANIICHYLAMGKRVLVTSMKDPALVVLQEKLPTEIRPLAISLLTSEQEGMMQFRNAIEKIAAEVQRLDRHSLSREITQIENSIDAYHAKLAKIDNQIGEWAIKNLTPIELDDEILEPLDAAEIVINNEHTVSWFEDAISISAEFCPRFCDSDIVGLRDARRILLNDLDYLTCTLPLISAFPDAQELMRAHQDLARAMELQAQVDSGKVTPLADSSKQTFDSAQSLSSQISNLKLLYQSVQNNENWPSSLLGHLRSGSKKDILEMFESLGREINVVIDERKKFLTKPVTVPDNIDLNAEVLEGLRNLVEGKRPFGLAGLFGKKAEKTLLDAICITNSPPVETSDWQHVLDYVCHLKSCRDLLTRWNALTEDIQIPKLQAKPAQITAAGDAYDLYRRLVEIVIIEGKVVDSIKRVLPTWTRVTCLQLENGILDDVEQILLHHLTRNRLAASWALKERFQKVLSGCTGRIVNEINAFLDSALGNPDVTDAEIQSQWTALMEELRRILSLKSHLDTVSAVSQLIQASGAPKWASRLCLECIIGSTDNLLPDNWREAWKIKRLSTYLNSIDSREKLKRLTKLRVDTEADLARAYQTVVTKRTWLKLAENATPDVRSALMAYMAAIAKIGRGSRGAKRAIRYRQDARNAASKANPAIPCWIMPHYRISESLPAEFGCFDLVIIDEASQSDLTALPAILRARKILIVGDDKQVSPEGVGLEEEKIRNLMTRFLANQIETYRPQMTPERSIYDLFKVVFAKSAVMLKEHFRCVAPIIEYSKREFYNHELNPLRIPKASERLSPPLVDVIVEDGFRKGDINPAEARSIVDEIKAIVQDPMMTKRSIGVVSLLGDKQAIKTWEMLEEEIGMDMIQRHKITCGDARTFQGKERDIMFLSMVVSKGDAKALSGLTYEQRFNVAASRAQNRMYLVRSVLIDDLGTTDIRKKLLSHFSTPFAQNENDVADKRKRCESPFEREIYDILTERGYRVLPQVPVGEFRIDMVVEGNFDNRLAVECDGDRYHGLDKWDDDMRRQRILERAGWRFWRCFASTFVMNRQDVIQDLLATLDGFGIEPIGSENNEALSIHTEQRRITAFDKANDTEI